MQSVESSSPLLIQGQVSPDRKNTLSLEEKVNKLALYTFFQISTALTVGVGLMIRCAAPLGATLVVAGLVGALLYWTVETIDLKWKGKSLYQNTMKTYITISQGTAVALGALGQAGGPGYYIHELGHACAALACYQEAAPDITVIPFQGGETTFNSGSGLTRFGKLLGARGSMILFTIAGVAISTLFAMGNIEIAHKLKEKCHWVRQVLTSVAVAQLVSEVFYGLGVFFVKGAGVTHDFMRLWMITGIHPLIPVTLIIALPYFQYTIHQLGKELAATRQG